jgi:putative Flp pilus-assembly TadE/G-like protein
VRRRGAARRGEAGQVTVMIIGFVVVLVMLFAVVVDASAAYLRRQSLSSLADGAALAAADAIEGEQVYTRGLGQRAVVDPDQARWLVESYLSSVEARSVYPGLVDVVETSGDRVVVRLSAPLDLPLPLPGVESSAAVQTESASVIAVSD